MFGQSSVPVCEKSPGPPCLERFGTLRRGIGDTCTGHASPMLFIYSEAWQSGHGSSLGKIGPNAEI